MLHPGRIDGLPERPCVCIEQLPLIVMKNPIANGCAESGSVLTPEPSPQPNPGLTESFPGVTLLNGLSTSAGTMTILPQKGVFL